MLRHPEGIDPVHQTLHQNDVDHLVHDRIGSLYAVASETRGRQDDHGTRGDAGLVARTRVSLGRHLVSLGESVSGSRATHA
jgi:hypothetical protein